MNQHFFHTGLVDLSLGREAAIQGAFPTEIRTSGMAKKNVCPGNFVVTKQIFTCFREGRNWTLGGGVDGGIPTSK